MVEIKNGKLRETGMFQKGFNKEDVMFVLDELNMRIMELESELEKQKIYSEELKKQLEIKK